MNLRVADRAKKSEYNKTYYKKHAKAINAKNVAWNRENAEYIKVLARATYRANPKKMLAKVSAWRKKHRAKVLLAGAAYRTKHPGRWKRWYAANADVIKAQHAAYRKANRSLFNAKNAKRRAAKIRATPQWAERSAIKDVYIEAEYMQMDVDHIIPLQHPLVCGLHVWDNLQLLTSVENIAKGNRFNPTTHVHTL